MLVLGTNKTKHFLKTLPESFLLIDDGEVIDQLTLPKRRKVTRLDFSQHTFNPLKGLDYARSRAFIEILDAVFPEGANTLTKKNSNYKLLKALEKKPLTLDTIIEPSNDAAQTDAYQKIDTILTSPLLRKALSGPDNFTFKGILIARLDKSIPRFDRFVLGNFLISRYPGHIVIPDYGFYATENHLDLIHRLTAGLHFLDEVSPKMRHNLLLSGPRIAARCSSEDAEVLAAYECPYAKGTRGYREFIEECVE